MLNINYYLEDRTHYQHLEQNPIQHPHNSGQINNRHMLLEVLRHHLIYQHYNHQDMNPLHQKMVLSLPNYKKHIYLQNLLYHSQSMLHQYLHNQEDILHPILLHKLVTLKRYHQLTLQIIRMLDRHLIKIQKQKQQRYHHLIQIMER